MIRFEILKPDNFLKVINPEWSVAYFTGIGKAKLNGGLESAGINSTSFLENTSVYIMAFGIGLSVLLLLLIFFIIKKFRAKITKILKA